MTTKPVRVLMGAALLLALLLAVGTAAMPQRALAQGGAITYGQTVVDSITAQTPFVAYTFNGGEGDVVTAYALAVQPGMALNLSLLDPQQQELASNEADPLGGGDPDEVRLTFRLPESGLYALLLTETAGTPGDFVLRLNGRSAVDGEILTPNQAAAADLEAGGSDQGFVFNGNPTLPTTLVVTLAEPADPDFAFLARIYDGEGTLLATIGGTGVQVGAVTLAPADTFYEILLSNLSLEAQGGVSLLISEGSPQTQPPSQPQQPIATSTPLPPAQPTVCTVTSTTQANVRRGPSTQYDIVGALPNGTSAPVVGRSADGAWFVIDLNGRQGWISAVVVLTSGPCSGLTIFSAPPTPTPVATATPLPTATPATSISFTADRFTINLGECVNLSWNVQGVSAVFYQGQGVAGAGSRQECPSFTTTYNLTVTLQNGQQTTQTVTITVVGGYRINFTTTANSVTAGQCVTLSWSVEGVSAVYFQGTGVTGSGAQQECPAATTTYVLRVITNNNQTIDTPITVTVNP